MCIAPGVVRNENPSLRRKMDKLTPYQEDTLEEIERLKAILRKPGPYYFESGREATRKQMEAKILNLARSVAMVNDRERDLKNGHKNDPGGRSRSPSGGRFKVE